MYLYNLRNEYTSTEYLEPNNEGLLQKAAYGLMFFIVLLPIIQHRYTHPGSTGSLSLL